jgi:hypothetical protein
MCWLQALPHALCVQQQHHQQHHQQQLQQQQQPRWLRQQHYSHAVRCTVNMTRQLVAALR